MRKDLTLKDAVKSHAPRSAKSNRLGARKRTFKEQIFVSDLNELVFNFV